MAQPNCSCRVRTPVHSMPVLSGSLSQWAASIPQAVVRLRSLRAALPGHRVHFRVTLSIGCGHVLGQSVVVFLRADHIDKQFLEKTFQFPLKDSFIDRWCILDSLLMCLLKCYFLENFEIICKVLKYNNGPSFLMCYLSQNLASWPVLSSPSFSGVICDAQSALGLYRKAGVQSCQERCRCCPPVKNAPWGVSKEFFFSEESGPCS